MVQTVAGTPVPRRAPAYQAVVVLVQLLLATSLTGVVAAQAGNWCGDDYNDSRKCQDECPGAEDSECAGLQSCFAVESCAADDRVISNAFCGEDYTDAAACGSADACPSGKNSDCNPGSECFAVTTCRGGTPSSTPPTEAPAPTPVPSTRAPAPAGNLGSAASNPPQQAVTPAAAPPPLDGTAVPALPADAADAGALGALGCSAEVPCPAGQRCEDGGCRESDTSGGIGDGAIAGIAVGITAALLLLTVALWAWWRHRRRSQRQRGDVEESNSKEASTSRMFSAPPKPASSAIVGALPPESLRKHHSANIQSATTMTSWTACSTYTNGTFGCATMLPQSPPGQKAGTGEAMVYMHHQLNLHGDRTPFLGKYQLLGDGAFQRFQGGQAIVQIARDQVNGLEVAIKCYVSKETCDAEARLYLQDSPLKQFMPELYAMHDNSDGDLRDPHGHPLPPCIIMEKGESLDIFCARSKPDRAQAYSVVLQVAGCIAKLHEAGFAHRDLKPSNTMWLTRENRWTLIDFGCAARIGSTAHLLYSLGYAAPEVIQAAREGVREIVAAAALDAWALGVMVLELFGGRSMVTMSHGKAEVMAQIAGDAGKCLPWEDPSQAGPLLARLGPLKRVTLGLLQRDAAHRLSVQEFVHACDRVLASTTQGQE